MDGKGCEEPSGHSIILMSFFFFFLEIYLFI